MLQHVNFMINSNKNICLKSTVFIFFIVVSSCILHVFLIILLIHCIYDDSIDHISLYNTYDHVTNTFLLPTTSSIVEDKKLYDRFSSDKTQPLVETKQILSTPIFVNNPDIKDVNNIAHAIDFENILIDQNNIIHDVHDTDFQCSSPITTNSINTVDIRNQRPNLIKYVYPEYPKEAKALSIEGRVVVMYDINHIGKVEKIRIISSIPLGIFEKNIKIAMRRWIYAVDNAKKDLIIIFKFSLNTIQFLEN